MEPLSNIAEKLYPAAGDPLAHYRRGQRITKRGLDELDELSRMMREQSRAQLAALRSSFQQQIEGAFRLFTKVQESDSKELTRWTLRICESYLQFAPELAGLSDEFLDMESLKSALLKVNDVDSSFFRCSVISNSQLLKRAEATSSPTKRLQLRRARRKILKEARQHLNSRAEDRKFIGQMLMPTPERSARGETEV